MSTPDFSALVARHRAYFRTGATRAAEWRESQLGALRAMMTDRARDFHAALWTDLRRNRTDADATDVKFLATEADHAQLTALDVGTMDRNKLKPVIIILNNQGYAIERALEYDENWEYNDRAQG